MPPGASGDRRVFARIIARSERLATLLRLVRGNQPDLDLALDLWDGTIDRSEVQQSLARVVEVVQGLGVGQSLTRPSATVADAVRAYLQARGKPDQRAALLVVQTLWIRSAIDLGCFRRAQGLAASAADGLRGYEADWMKALAQGLGPGYDRDGPACDPAEQGPAFAWGRLGGPPSGALDPVPGGAGPAGPDLTLDPSAAYQGPPTDATAAVPHRPRPDLAGPLPPDCDLDPAALDKRMALLGTAVEALGKGCDALRAFYRNWSRKVAADPGQCAAFRAAYPAARSLAGGLVVGDLRSDLESVRDCLERGQEGWRTAAANPSAPGRLERVREQLQAVDRYLAAVQRVVDQKTGLARGIAERLLVPCPEPGER